MIRVFKILFVFYLICGLGCFNSGRPGAKEYYEIAQMSGSDNTERLNKFSLYPIEKQIDIYLFANCCVEGGGGSGVIALTKDGERKIPYIIKRIEIFPDDIRNKVALISALYEINKDCACLKKHPEYLQTLERVGERIKTEKSSLEDEYKTSYINYYDDYLKDIKRNVEGK